MTTMREHILDEAKKCVLKDRNLDYDEPEKNFEDIANYWNIYLADKLKAPILPHDTAIMTALIKVARIQKSPSKQDHWVDLAGYAACGAECVVEGPNEETWIPLHGQDMASMEIEFLDSRKDKRDWKGLFGNPGDGRAMFADLVDAKTGKEKYRLVSTEELEWKDFSEYTER